MANVPDVAQAVVFAVPHPVLQNSVLAALEPRPGRTVDVAAVLDFLRTQLPGYAVPRRSSSAMIFREQRRENSTGGRLEPNISPNEINSQRGHEDGQGALDKDVFRRKDE